MKKILVLILLGVITILTPLSFKANYYSIDQPVIDLNNYTLNEVFTDTINDLDQYKITSILDLQAYEGLSLRDIFESEEISATGKNLFDKDDYILLNSGTPISNLILNNNELSFTSDSTSGLLYYFRCYPNQLFTLSGKLKGRAYIELRDIDNNFIIGTRSSTAGYSTLTEFTKKIPVSSPNSYYVHVKLDGAIGFDGNFILENPQLEQGTVATTYESYLDLDMILATPSLYGTVDLVHWETGSLFTTAPSQLQLDEWLSFYLDPSTIASFDMVGDIQVYKAGTSFYNLTEMIDDKIYSNFNLDTFDNLTEGEITDQFGAWQTLGIEDIEVLSLTEFQTFAPALDQEDMLYWFNYYNLILEYDEVQAGILSDLEITILIIALVLFIIGIALAIYFQHKIMFFVTGLLWFVPIVIVPNIFIITFSVIMIIIFGLLAFYNSQGKDFD